MTTPGVPLKLEFRIPASPNEKYMRMLRYFVESLQVFGGPIARAAHCVVSVGADESPRDLMREYPWAANYSIEFQWLERDLFRHHSYEATGYHRLWVRSDADIVVLADADLLFTGDFDRVIERSYQEQRLFGCIAHVSPFSAPRLAAISSETWWNRIFSAAELPKPRLEWEHTGWGLMSKDPKHRYCPPYFNYGFIVAPRVFVERMGETFVQELNVVDSVVATWFKSQIANTLAFARHDIPCGGLPINYNFPLHIPADAIRALNPDPQGENSLEYVKVFHYLGKGEINKAHFATQRSFTELLHRHGMSEAGALFQRKLRIVYERIVAGVGAPGPDYGESR